MNAIQAKLKTDEVIQNNSESQINEINKLIQASINKGEFKTHYYKPLKPAVKHQLINYGYAVEDGQDRDGVLVTISWA